MSSFSRDLPDDPQELRLFAAALRAELLAKDLMIEKLTHQLAVLRRARFGRSSEKLDREIQQLELMIGELEENQAGAAARQDSAEPPAPAAADVQEPEPPPASAAVAQRKARARRPLPRELPRDTVRHEPPHTCPECGGTALSRIGEDEREVLEYVPAHFKVIRHVRPKVSCRACETIRQAPMPSLPIERGLPGPGLLAHVAIAKYCDHLPLYRQSEIYARSGLDLDRGLLADWIGRLGVLLEPLAERIAVHARAGGALHADDTPVPVLDPGRGKTKTGRLWVLVRDERPWGSPVAPAAVYLYSPDRKGEHAETLLGQCRGFLHADAYAGFNSLYAPGRLGPGPRLTEVACWAHVRRKIYDVHVETDSPAAREALERMAELFAIEADIRGRDPAQRLAVRQARSVPKLDELKAFLDETLAQISRKAALAGAIRYATARWPALTRYAADGRLEMTNNAAERAIRPLAIGRKNYLFAGSDDGGRRAATLYTLIQTARLNDVEPEAWLAQVIARIADHPNKRLDELLPWRWKQDIERKAA
jgi:transposase